MKKITDEESLELAMQRACDEQVETLKKAIEEALTEEKKNGKK